MGNESLTWIAGDSSTYRLFDYAVDSRRGVLSIIGFGLPDIEHTSQPFPFQHGMLDIARRFRDRKVQIAFWQNWDTRAAWQSGREAIRDALNPNLGKGQLKFIDANGIDWRLDAWVNSTPLERSGEWSPLEIRTVLEFWVPWPFWRKSSQESEDADFNGINAVNIAISNDGNVPTIPNTIVLTTGAGEQITNPVLLIVGTGLTIDLEHTMAQNEQITITCFPPDDVSILEAGGGSIIGDLTYDSVVAGFELPRGASTFRITGGNAGDNGNCQINFYEWFLAL